MPEPIETPGGSYDAKTRNAADACRGHHRRRCGDGGRRLTTINSRSTQGNRRLRSNSKIKPISRVWLTPRRNNADAPPPRARTGAAPRAAAAAPDLTAQLQQLAQLHTAGVLSDEEFAQAKQKLLAG